MSTPPPAAAPEEGEKPDSEASIRWLRERGVQVETVEDRKRAQQLSTTFYKGREDVREVPFVRIPADTSEPMEQRIMYVPKGDGGYGDQLAEMLKPEFTGGKLDHDLFSRTAQSSFGTESAKISASTLEKSVKQGSTETFRLVAPAESNSYHGVYIHLDEVGMLKGLPRNGRATALAETCGFGPPPPVFYGDVFVGRVKTRPAPMINVALTVADLDSSQAWIQRAQVENFQFHEAMGQVTDQMEASNVGAPVGSDGRVTEDETKAFTWTQTEEDVEVTVPVAKVVNKKKLKVVLSRQRISVKYDGDEKVEMEVPLFAPVDAEESSWSLSDGQVVFSLEKARQDSWPQIRKVE